MKTVRPPKRLHHHVCHQTRMASIAIRKGMNCNEPMMQARAEFIYGIRIMVPLVSRIVTQNTNLFRQEFPRNTDVLVAVPVTTSLGAPSRHSRPSTSSG
jgi:hypothetical protein